MYLTGQNISYASFGAGFVQLSSDCYPGLLASQCLIVRIDPWLLS